ncbi:hypothetical protein NEUTE1DRAFT_100907 [Neurospora tetrasperma FGSC 2508]|uniref:Uncharacterized protein n=1 Tax=Neurospora tetrasperma (strain FGSC 2508 / ATCC MYA-4615 / P0657) TaxID=510951 RepID=F8MN10_NEUT8|nr:uncharacterized protein NEUTE1DRAFT_100907 [Neurospora tetrasperma FGSC 2508]EGO58034.1 hypothetical protein NEUTE1DRAFT_100907 [Neurospora tetrasperma FGSC 2508]EGZ71660.1 hypothetical protein NEUTE2DRAFT_129051 [Neurospora tetrasperma FGSC 2509]
MILSNPGASIAIANPRHPRPPVVLSFQRYSQHRHQSVYDKCYGNCRWTWKGGQKLIVESENAPALGSFASGEEMGQGIEQQQTHRCPSFPSVVDVMNRQISKIPSVSVS